MSRSFAAKVCRWQGEMKKINSGKFNKEPTARSLHSHHAVEGDCIGRRLVINVVGRIRWRFRDRFSQKFKVKCG